MYSDNLQPGLTNITRNVVSEKNTAVYFGSGDIEVLATPALVAFMEKTAFLVVEPFLSDGYSTVGISIHVEHIGAATRGEYFDCKAELISVDDKKFTFSIEANSKKRKLATAKHIRYLIHKQKFMTNLKD